MAENFEDVVKNLGEATKKPSAGKAQTVLAVQMVDSKGKVIKEEKGAAAAEAQREEEKRGKKTNTLLERIAAGMSGKQKMAAAGAGGAAVGGILGTLAETISGGASAGMKGLWKGASKAFSNPKMAKVMGPLAIAGGIALMVKDGMAAMKMSKEWGVSKTSAAMGGILGGMDSGFKGAMKNMGKWALIGAGIGSIVPVVGTLVGGLIGAAIGAILGWIGGEKIAKFFDKVGKWVSEKWDIIKAFPGKIWTGIVDTVKGWLGLTSTGKVPVTVDEKDKPKKGWLDSIIDFLIPDWLIKFAKDALGTVTGWLGLTKKDDQGKVTTTAFGKMIFGTIGSLANVAMNFIKKFIPQFVIDFVAAPLDTIMTWIGLKEKDKKTGAVTTSAFGKELFGKVKKVGDILGDIIERIIGKPTWTAITKFATNPIDYVLIDILGWKDKAGKATEAGKAAVKTMETGVLPTISLIIERIIGKPTFDAIKSFATGPIDYVLVNWLGWKTKGGKLTTTGMEAMKKLDEGKMAGFWTQLMKKIIGKDTYNTIVLFVKDPIDYIFVHWLKLKSKDDKKITTGEKAGVIAGTVVGLWGKLMAAILPKGVVDFIMSPINWAFKLFGLDKPGDTLAAVEEAHGLTIGDKESRTGLFAKMLNKILPKGLMKFFKNPLNWVLETLLGPEILAKITGGTYEEAQSVIKKSQFDSGGLFNQIIEKIIPKALMDFIKSPIDWILKNWLGVDLGAKIKEGPIASPLSEKEKEERKKKNREDMINSILGQDTPWYVPERALRWSAEQILPMLGFAKGGSFAGGRPMIVGELGPEIIMPSGGGQVMNAQRTQQMIQSGMQRGMGGDAGGGGTTSINTGGNVVSSPTTNYVNNGTAARRPIYLTTATALA